MIISGFICSKKDANSKIVCRTTNDLTVSYDLNGGSGNSCSSKKVSYGNIYGTLCDGKTLTAPENKEFDGWWTSKDGGIRISETSIVDAIENITLYAHWKQMDIQLTVIKGNGIESISTPSNCTLLESEPPAYNYNCTYGTTVNLMNVATAEIGYNIPTWTVESSETEIIDNEILLSSKNISLNVNSIKKQYIVTLDHQGATTPGQASITTEYNGIIPTVTIPIKTGSTFHGYYTEINGGGTKYINEDGTSTQNWNIDSSTTLYAYWEENNGIVPTVLRNDYEDGEHTILAGGMSYIVRIINVYDGKTGDDDGTTNGTITISSDKEYGDISDVGTASDYASRMVIVKYHGNVTIDSGATVSSVKSESGYGGPKGMYLCSTGTIINNGTISMTARGAKAIGEDVYLYSSDLENWEFVPAIGATPGTKVSMATTTSSYSKTGANGKDGSTVTTSPRATGGGGQGGMRKTNNTGSTTVTGGLGTAGTSYSGGTGGGGATQNNTNTTTTGGSATANGGVGGKGTYQNSGSAAAAAGGGAGNPGGNYSAANPATSNTTTLNQMKGHSGTGGLLIIYGEDIINNGIISSNGSAGGLGNSSTILGSDDYPKSSGGGGSGGGSINIFYRNEFITSETSEITCTGGAGGYGGIASGSGVTRGSGGAGGQGTSNVTQINIPKK